MTGWGYDLGGYAPSASFYMRRKGAKLDGTIETGKSKRKKNHHLHRGVRRAGEVGRKKNHEKHKNSKQVCENFKKKNR